jgi:hypothetical protein
MASAAIDLLSGMWRCRGRPTATDNRKDQPYVGRIDVLLTRNADGPVQSTLTERVPELSAQVIAGVGQHASEAHAGASDPIKFLDGDLGI